MAYKAEFRQEITAKDGTKKVLSNLQNNIKRTGKAGKTAGAAASGGFKSMLGPLVAVAASVMALKKVLDLSKEGAQANAVEAAFERLNKGGAKLLATMREKSGGILDDTSLQMIANKLSAVTNSTETMGRVAQSAMKIAAATGKDYKATLEGLTQAIVTGRSASLASLGIVVDAKKVQAEYAATLGKTANELTQAEKKTAAMNGALAESERQFGAVNTLPLEDGVARLTTRFENLKSSIAQTTSSFFTFVVDTIEGVDRIKRSLEQDYAEGIVDSFGRLPVAFIEAARNAEEIKKRTAELVTPYEKILAYAEKHTGEIKSAEGLMRLVQQSEVGAWRWSSRRTDEWMKVKGLLEEANTLGLGYNETLGTMRTIIKDIYAAQKKANDSYSDTATVTTHELGEQVKAEQAKLANITKYWKIQDEILSLSKNGYDVLNVKERARLDLLGLQALHMTELGTATEDMFDQWEQARGVDAVLAKVKGLRVTLKEISAGDVMRGLLGITPGKTPADKPDAVSYGPSRAERAEQARQALEAQIEAGNEGIKAHREMLDRAAAEDLDRVKRVAKEAQQIQAEIYDFEQALAGKRATEEDILEAERTKRMAALTQEGGLESLENFAAAKKAIELWYDE